MKIFLIQLLFASTAFASGGDIGGGGTLPSAFRLSPQERAQLSRHQDPNVAFDVWMRSLDDLKQEELMLKVFDNLILPQIKNPQ